MSISDIRHRRDPGPQQCPCPACRRPWLGWMQVGPTARQERTDGSDKRV
jgi:hypothetical protein